MKSSVIKFLAVVVCLSICMVGCGKDSTNVPEEGTVGSVADAAGENTEEIMTASEPASSGTTILDSNGSLEEDFEGHDRSELYEITDIVFKAYQELDLDTLRVYLSDSDFMEASSHLEPIKQDPKNYQIWQNTVGTMIYFADSDVLLAKSTAWVESSWYTDCWENGWLIPASSSEDFSRDYLENIYNTYYVNAPYIACPNLSKEMDYRVENGYVRCDITGILEAVGHGYWVDLFNPYTDGYLYSALLLNNADCFTLGYNYILGDPEEGVKIPDYEVLYEGDLSEFVKVVNKYDIKDESGLYMETFVTYYEDETNRAIIQEYLDENCEIKRGLSEVAFFFPANFKEHYGYYDLTEDDIHYIESLGIECVMVNYIFEFPENWGNNFSPYYELVQCVKYEGLLE